jgi:flagellar assembly protein FliH
VTDAQKAGARKFSFDTVFDGGGAVISAPTRLKRAYTADEAEALRAEAYREGEASALASLQGLQAQAMADLAETARAGLAALSQVAHNHRVHAAGLAMACGKAIADAALDRFPQAPLQAALESLSREFNDAPRLTLRTPADPAVLAEVAEQIARDIGYPGQVVVKPEPGANGAAFSLDWADGSAVFNPDATAARIADVVASALAAERLHADPIDLSPHAEA